MDIQWDKIKKSLKEGAAISIEKIDQYARVGKLKIDILAVEHKLNRVYADMGERSFNLIDEAKGDQISADLAILRYIESVKAYKNELIELAERLDTINEEAKKRTASRLEKANLGEEGDSSLGI